MNDGKDRKQIDPLLHARLDGEASPSDSAAFEGDLRSGATLANQHRIMKDLEAWLGATRSRAPSSLARDVVRALEVEREITVRAIPSPRRLRALRRWVWIPAAAAAAALLWTAIPQDRAPDRSGGRAGPPERAIFAEQGTAPGATPPGRSEAAADFADGEAGNPVTYTFRYVGDATREVCLAGDFNQWRVCEAPLRRVGEDVWSLSLDLPPGRYEYMFVVDGRWVTDPDAVAYNDDGFGHRNAVLLL